jgi:hypothetical protein
LPVRFEDFAGEIERAQDKHDRRRGAVGVAGDPADRVGDVAGGQGGQPFLPGSRGKGRGRVVGMAGTGTVWSVTERLRNGFSTPAASLLSSRPRMMWKGRPAGTWDRK